MGARNDYRKLVIYQQLVTNNQKLGRLVFCGSNQAHTGGEEQDAQDAIREDFPDVMATTAPINKVNRSYDQTDHP